MAPDDPADTAEASVALIRGGESVAGAVVSTRDLGPLAPGWGTLAFEDRYSDGDVLGRGGMGEVRTARDHRVGRDVAIKRLREPAGHGDPIARFLREARVQGRLEHPAVVPV